MSGSKFTASPEDGKEILRILESSAAEGSIELIYTRRPDAYESYMNESGEMRVFVSKRDERTVGTCAQLIRQVYIGGEKRNCAYICGLKKDAEYGGRVGFGAEFIRGLYRDDIDFYYCSVVADNSDARKMFEKAKRIISIKPFAQYKTFIINPKVKLRVPEHTFLFRQATEEDGEKLIEFLNTEGQKKDLFPVFGNLNEFYNLNYSDFYLLLKENEILSAAALWNQTSYKQYVVKKYRRFMKFARIINPLLSLLGYIKLPKENQPLEFPMLSFFVSKDDNSLYYRIFLNEIKKVIIKKHGMFVIGLPKKHFAYPIFDSLPSISFETRLYEISFPWSGRQGESVSPENIYPECGLL